MLIDNMLDLSDFKSYDDFKNKLKDYIVFCKKNKIKRLYLLNDANLDYINKETIQIINKNGLSIINNMFNSNELIIEFN